MWTSENQEIDITQQEQEDREQATDEARKRQQNQVRAVEVGDAVWADMV